MNRVEILGNVGKTPEVKSTSSGKIVVNFSVATTERYSHKESGEMIENTEWHNLVCFGRQAEIVRDYVNKGSKVFVVGKLKTRSWDDKESGKKMYRTDIIAESVGLLSGKPAAGEHSDAAKQDQDYADQGITDADIPF